MKKNDHLLSEICILYLYELLKPGETVGTTTIPIWTVCCLKKARIPKEATQSFFIVTMLYHIWQNQFMAHWKHSAGKFYFMWLTYQIWLLLITTCLHCWVMHFVSSIIVRTSFLNKCLNECFVAKWKNFTGVGFINCL